MFSCVVDYMLLVHCTFGYPVYWTVKDFNVTGSTVLINCSPAAAASAATLRINFVNAIAVNIKRKCPASDSVIGKRQSFRNRYLPHVNLAASCKIVLFFL